MSQSRLASFTESCVNIAVGFGVAMLTQYAAFPLFGIHASHGEHFAIAAIFTVVSLIRSYLLRRAFNWYHYHR